MLPLICQAPSATTVAAVITIGSRLPAIRTSPPNQNGSRGSAPARTTPKAIDGLDVLVIGLQHRQDTSRRVFEPRAGWTTIMMDAFFVGLNLAFVLFELHA